MVPPGPSSPSLVGWHDVAARGAASVGRPAWGGQPERCRRYSGSAMNDADALHTAARAYVIDRSQGLTDAFDRTRRAVLGAILTKIERSVPGQLGSLEEAREQLIAAAWAGWSDTTTGIDLARNPMRAQEWAEERDSVIAYVRGLSPVDLALAEALPYRRTLSDDEARDLRRRFVHAWAFDPADTPLTPADEPDVQEFVRSRFIDQGGGEQARQALLGRGITRVLMFCRWDSACYRELDVSSLRWEDEATWFDRDLDWFVGRGDDVLTVAGWLFVELRSSWPAWRDAVRRADWT